MKKVQFDKVQSWFERNEKLPLLVVSYTLILVLFLNLSLFHSPFVGTAASIFYLFINGAFWGKFILEMEYVSLRLTFGSLFFFALLGLTSWGVMIAYNLDTVRSIIVLCIASTLTSLTALKTKRSRPLHSLTSSERLFSVRLLVLKLLYFSFFTLVVFLLFLSRATEVHNVWEALHPSFIPAFFITTFLLLAIVFSSERLGYKLLMVIMHSILSYIFVVFIFPTGLRVGVQEEMLGKMRLVFDNLVYHGFGWNVEGIVPKIFRLSWGDNFQTAVSVMTARMFGIDIYWSHLLLIRILWGTFAPLTAFMIVKMLGQSGSSSVLAGFLTVAFPINIIWGADAVPQSLGYVFFFCGLFFILKYMISNEPWVLFSIVTFSLVSFLTHFLVGIMSFALLLLAVAVRQYSEAKLVSPWNAKILLLVSVIFSASLVPLALMSLRFFYPSRTHFGLESLNSLSSAEIVGLFLIGEYINFSPGALFVHILGPILGFIAIVYCIKVVRRQDTLSNGAPLQRLLLSLAFLVFLVDYRILKIFMVDVPFKAERIWPLRDFVAVVFVTILIGAILSFLKKKRLDLMRKFSSSHITLSFVRRNVRPVGAYILAGVLLGAYLVAPIFLSGWITASVYYAYPHYGPLQTTSYELEAVKFIEMNTTERYIVIADQWIIYAGVMFVGIGNSRAFYFSSLNSTGITLFIEMRRNPSKDVMINAMRYNNASVAYFIIEETRLGSAVFKQVIERAQQNGLQVYKTFGDGKLCIFRYKQGER